MVECDGCRFDHSQLCLNQGASRVRYASFAALDSFTTKASCTLNIVNLFENHTALREVPIFEAIWTTGDDPNDPAVLAKLACTIGVELSQLSSQAVKDALRLETEKALAHGVFGVPTHRLDQQLFWGADATDFVKAYLDDASVLNSDEMQRVATLPIGAIRKSA